MVKLPDREDRCSHRTNDANAGKRTDNNLNNRIDKFANQLKSEFYYRIPLSFLYDLGLVNQLVKFNTKWLLKFETDYQRLFETEVSQAMDTLPNSVDAKIILTSTPYILCEQFQLDDNYRVYLEDVMISNHVLRMGIKTTPYQKSYKLVTGSQSRTVTFEASNKQLSFLEFLLVYDSSKQHKSIYDSYNTKVAVVQIGSVKLENASNTYSEFNTIKFDLNDEHNKYLLYSVFMAWICKASSIAPLSDYAHDKTHQKMVRIEKYFTDSDKRLYIDLRQGKGHTREL